MTLEEVARQAGVSTATVSRVLNNPSIVKESTRLRVLAAAKKLNYRPNRYAQGLAGGRSRTLGVIVSNIENPYFLDILHSLEERAAKAGLELVYENTDYSAARLAAAVELMLARPLAGLAVMVSENEPEAVRQLIEWGRPVVVTDLCEAQGAIAQIKIRYEQAMRRAVEYLYELGHRRMAFVGHHQALDSLREREHAFLSTMKRYRDVEHAAASSEDSPAGGRAAALELLSSGFRPTAILCVNDFMAIGVLRELREAGLRTPQDVSVAGFDNIQLAEYLNPSLTTVNIPRQRIGEAIFEALAPQERQARPPARILIDPELVVRESTAPPPVSQ